MDELTKAGVAIRRQQHRGCADCCQWHEQRDGQSNHCWELGRTGQYEAIVDDEDSEWLARYSWNFKFSTWRYGRKIYARRYDWRTGRTVLMHREILETRIGVPQPDETATVDHEDTNSLSNTRSNLRWATKSEQSLNQKPRITAAKLAAIGTEEIPF